MSTALKAKGPAEGATSPGPQFQSPTKENQNMHMNTIPAALSATGLGISANLDVLLAAAALIERELATKEAAGEDLGALVDELAGINDAIAKGPFASLVDVRAAGAHLLRMTDTGLDPIDSSMVRPLLVAMAGMASR